jgi:hypothetical protein
MGEPYPVKGRSFDATSVVERLPASVRPLLRGKERTYNNFEIVQIGPANLHIHQPQVTQHPIECSEVTAEEARALSETLNAGVLPDPLQGEMIHVGEIGMWLFAIHPHGGPVSWAFA